jgi:hypothetical protein
VSRTRTLTLLAGGEHVVQTTITDVVCPSVTTDDPHGSFLTSMSATGNCRLAANWRVGLHALPVWLSAAATRLRWARIPASIADLVGVRGWHLARSAPILSFMAVHQFDSILGLFVNWSGACRDQIRRCLQRGSWTMPGRVLQH